MRLSFPQAVATTTNPEMNKLNQFYTLYKYVSCSFRGHIKADDSTYLESK